MHTYIKKNSHTGRHSPETPRSKRLLSDDRSNILIYLTGHGGEEFLKFQDVEELTSQDLADAFEQMHQQRRYNEIFFMIDTCQAASLYKRFHSPNILAVGSSKLGENSYSVKLFLKFCFFPFFFGCQLVAMQHHTDSFLGLAVIDRFTYYVLEFFDSIDFSMDSNATFHDLVLSKKATLELTNFLLLFVFFFGTSFPHSITRNSAPQSNGEQTYSIDPLIKFC
jgi:phosphatidylinositol glycan class K